MKLFDLHCDTATGLLKRSEKLYDNSLHVSLKKAEYLDTYAQIMAIWTEYKLSDSEGFAKFFEVADNLEKEIILNSERACLVNDFGGIYTAINAKKRPLILAVEDARILEGDILRLNALYDKGVRLLTLNWSGESCIGGAHNTDIGLSDFGIEVVKKCFELGIIPDVSHSSFEGTRKAIELAFKHNKTIVASHSDSYSVNPHTRNLRDEDFIDIMRLEGLVGINLCPEHLNSKMDACLTDVIKHIEHYLSLGGENVIAMGTDLDGTDLPNGFKGIADIYKIFEELQRLNYSEDLINKIAFENAFAFFKRNL